MAAPYDPTSLSYSLPTSMTSIVDGRFKIANAMGVTSALFANFAMALAGLVADQQDSGAAGVALRIFLYSGIGSNLISSACSFWTVSALSQMPYTSQRQAIHKRESWSYRAASHSPLEQPMLEGGEHELLRKFGLGRVFKWQIIGAALWFLLGLSLEFVALVIWIWSSQPIVVAIPVTVILGPGCLGAILPVIPGVVQLLRLTPE